MTDCVHSHPRRLLSPQPSRLSSLTPHACWHLRCELPRRAGEGTVTVGYSATPAVPSLSSLPHPRPPHADYLEVPREGWQLQLGRPRRLVSTRLLQQGHDQQPRNVQALGKVQGRQHWQVSLLPSLPLSRRLLLQLRRLGPRGLSPRHLNCTTRLRPLRPRLPSIRKATIDRLYPRGAAVAQRPRSTCGRPSLAIGSSCSVLFRTP